MKQFLYKTIIIIVAFVLIYEFTVAKQIKKMSSQVDIFLSKEGRKEGVEKIRKELRFKPKINFKDGIKLTFEWYRNNKSYYKSLSKKDILKRLGKK